MRELARAGFDAGHATAEKPEDLSAILDGTGYDLIVTEYAAPGWSWRAALEALRARAELVPLIVLAREAETRRVGPSHRFGPRGRDAPADELRPGRRRGLLAHRRTFPPADFRQASPGAEGRAARSRRPGRGPGGSTVPPDLRGLSGRHPPGGPPGPHRIGEFAGGRNVPLPVGRLAGQVCRRASAQPFSRPASGVPRALPGKAGCAAHGIRFGLVGPPRRRQRVPCGYHFEPAGHQGWPAGPVRCPRYDGP